MHDDLPTPDGIDLEAAGFVPPDPSEPPPVELWSTVGDVIPWGSTMLLLAWALVFATLVFRRQIGDPAVYVAWGASMTGLGPGATAWRLLASTFIHAGAAHVFFNATSMLIFGPAVERMFHRWAFWIVYVLGGAAASAGSLAWRLARHPDGASVSVGASGAIFALAGALLAGAFRLRHRLAPGRARALGAALLYLSVQGLVSGFTEHGTDNAAHATGLLSGVLLGLLAPLEPRLSGTRAGLATRALGALCLLALGLALALGVRGGLTAG